MRPPVLALLGVAVLAAAPIPAPVVVDEPGGLPDGATLAPAVAHVEVAEDGALVTHRLAVGSGARIVFDLAVREVRPGPDGAPELGPPSDAVRLPAGSVTLDAGERATLTSLVHGGVSEPGLLAVTATPREAGRDPLVGLLAVVPPGTPPPGAPAVAAALEDEVLTVALTPSGPTPGVVDLRVRLVGPIGPAVLDDTLRDVLVWPDGGRELVWELDLPPWPIPYSLEAVAATADGEISRVAVTVWPPLRAWLPAAAALLVVMTTVAWWWARRRRRDGDPGTAPDEPDGTHG